MRMRVASLARRRRSDETQQILFNGDCYGASGLPICFIEEQSGGRTKSQGSGKVRQVQGIQGNRRCVSNWRPRHATRRLGKPNCLPELPASLGGGAERLSPRTRYLLEPSCFHSDPS